MTIQREKLLADRLHAMTYERKKHAMRLPPAVLPVQLKYRQRLKQARRFVLDDDAVRLVTQLQHEEKRHEHWAFLARLPYDYIWFEFRTVAKIEESKRLGFLGEQSIDYRHIPPQSGLLLYRDDEASPRWICHCFCNHPEDSEDVLVASIALLFDPEGDPRTPVLGSAMWKSPTLSLRPGFPKYDCYWEPGRPIQADAEYILSGTMHADWRTYRCAAIVDPWWEAAYAKYANGQPPGATVTLQDALDNDVREFASMLMWVMSLLFAINGLPKTTKPINPTRVSYSSGGRLLPFFTHENLSITIPHEEGLMLARKMLDKAARNAEPQHRRWHEVRGHWRVIEFGKRTYLCRHQPVMIESGLGICTRCELLVRWIPAHARGDEALGVVDKTYQVTT